MILFNKKKTKRNKGKQNNLSIHPSTKCDHALYSLPVGHYGSSKRLGDNVLIPWDQGKNANVLVLGSAGSGKKCSYIEPNIMTADDKSNCIVYMEKSEAEDIFERITDRDVFKLDLSKRPVDYFSLITDKADAERFINKMFDAHEFLFPEDSANEFYFETEKNVLLDVISVMLDRSESCNHKSIVEKLSEYAVGDTAYWVKKLRLLSADAQKSVFISLMTRLNELLPGDTIDYSSFINDFMHKTNAVLFVEIDRFEKSVYESIFLDELVHRYKQMYDKKTQMTKVIMDEAAICFYDAKLFGEEVRQFGMSIDFIYQSIRQLIKQHPNDYETIVNNAAAIVCLRTNDDTTIEFLTKAAVVTPEHMIDLRMMPLEDELILCPTLNKNPIIAKKIGRYSLDPHI